MRISKKVRQCMKALSGDEMCAMNVLLKLVSEIYDTEEKEEKQMIKIYWKEHGWLSADLCTNDISTWVIYKNSPHEKIMVQLEDGKSITKGYHTTDRYLRSTEFPNFPTLPCVEIGIEINLISILTKFNSH